MGSPTVVVLIVRSVRVEPSDPTEKKPQKAHSDFPALGSDAAHASPLLSQIAAPPLPVTAADGASLSSPGSPDAFQILRQLRREIKSRDAHIARLEAEVADLRRRLDGASGAGGPEAPDEEGETKGEEGGHEEGTRVEEDGKQEEDVYQSTDSEVAGCPLQSILSLHSTKATRKEPRRELKARAARHAARAARAAPGTIDAIFPALARNVLRGDGFVFGPAAQNLSLMLDRDSAGDTRGPKLAAGAQFDDLNELLSLAEYALGDAFLKRNRSILSGKRLGWMIRYLFPERLDAGSLPLYNEICEDSGDGYGCGTVIARFSAVERSEAAARRGGWDFATAFPTLARFFSGRRSHPQYACIHFVGRHLTLAKGAQLRNGAPPNPVAQADCTAAKTLHEVFVVAEELAKRVAAGEDPIQVERQGGEKRRRGLH